MALNRMPSVTATGRLVRQRVPSPPPGRDHETLSYEDVCTLAGLDPGTRPTARAA